LIDRWADAAGTREAPALLVIQWSPQMVAAPIDAAVARARERGIPVLELREVLEPVVKDARDRRGVRVHWSRAAVRRRAHEPRGQPDRRGGDRRGIAFAAAGV
jgi:hypothetical protein